MIKAKTRLSAPCTECGERTIKYDKVKQVTVTAKKKSFIDWYNMMVNLGEADIPYMSIDGTMYTPNEMKNHYDLQDEIWFKIKKRMI